MGGSMRWAGGSRPAFSPPFLRAYGLASALLALASCNTTPEWDLHTNEALYSGTGYHTQVPVDRAVYVTAVRDGRAEPEKPDDANWPTVWLSDASWQRSPVQMVQDVLADEIRQSGVFREVLERPRPDALILRPTLTAFSGGLEELPAGRRAHASVALRVEVLGPEDAHGKRATLLDRTGADRIVSNVVSHPPSPRKLAGQAMQTALAQVLAAVDQANVARSGVPLDSGSSEPGR